MPIPTDLVTDLPADFEVFGQAVDSSMADLLGGTTGQILAKNSNTNMDFVWIANDQGDITEITASSPLTGGGTSGAVTIGIQDGTTAQKGAVQLENSTSSTSTTTAAVPASVKSAYDLAGNAIPKSTGTTAGDVIYYTGASTPVRLGIGTAGQILTVNGGATAPSWTTPASGGKTWQQTSTASMSGASITVSSLTGQDILVSFEDWSATSTATLNWRMNSNSGNSYKVQTTDAAETSGRAFGDLGSSATGWSFLYIPAASSTAQIKMGINNLDQWAFKESSALKSLTFFPPPGNLDAGTYYVWELK